MDGMLGRDLRRDGSEGWRLCRLWISGLDLRRWCRRTSHSKRGEKIDRSAPAQNNESKEKGNKQGPAADAHGV